MTPSVWRNSRTAHQEIIFSSVDAASVVSYKRLWFVVSFAEKIFTLFKDLCVHSQSRDVT